MASRPQSGIIFPWIRASWAATRVIVITIATTPAVIPRGITIPQSCATAKASGSVVGEPEHDLPRPGRDHIRSRWTSP